MPRVPWDTFGLGAATSGRSEWNLFSDSAGLKNSMLE
jgi:hypothetical protein